MPFTPKFFCLSPLTLNANHSDCNQLDNYEVIFSTSPIDPVRSSILAANGYSGSFSTDFVPERRRRHRSEQYFTSSQQSAHFFRQVNGRSQTGQTLVGKSDFERERPISSRMRSGKETEKGSRVKTNKGCEHFCNDPSPTPSYFSSQTGNN